MSDDTQRQMRAVAVSAALIAAQAWREVDPQAVSVSWADRLPGVTMAVAGAQLTAAGLVNGHGPAPPTSGTQRVNPAAFGGVASDGRPLAGLLALPAITAILALAAGSLPAAAMAAGLAQLDMMVRTQVADAHRTATGAVIAADPELAGYERVVHLPACGRCLVLAGRLYRWSTGFLRHPRCDCTMAAVTQEQYRTQNLSNNPRDLFGLMSTEQQDKKLGKAGAQAIRDGADISQVVNARKGMSTTVIGGQKVATTSTGTTRRSAAGQVLIARSGAQKQGGRYRQSKQPRLMPEAIYAVATDREDAVRLLRANGFIL